MINCPNCGRFFSTSKAMHLHKRFHSYEHLIKLREGVRKKWSNKKYREYRTNLILGERNPMFGKKNKWGHHNEDSKKRISISRIGDRNPAKRLDVRKKISKALKGIKPWNKGIKWNRTKFHDSEMEKIAKDFKEKGFKVLTTHGYVPDAIIIDFKNNIVKAFELNPRSVLYIEKRAKIKGYDNVLTEVRKNGHNVME